MWWTLQDQRHHPSDLVSICCVSTIFKEVLRSFYVSHYPSMRDVNLGSFLLPQALLACVSYFNADGAAPPVSICFISIPDQMPGCRYETVRFSSVGLWLVSCSFGLANFGFL